MHTRIGTKVLLLKVQLSRYWVDVTLMYEKKDMSDPEAIHRLLQKDCKSMERRFIQPHVESTFEDFETLAEMEKYLEEVKLMKNHLVSKY